MNPFTITLEVDLGGGAGFTIQVHRLILHNIGFFRLNKKMWQRLRWIRWKGFWQFMKKVIVCENKKKVENGQNMVGTFATRLKIMPHALPN